MNLKQWFKNQKKKQEKESFNLGYDLCAGKLLNGTAIKTLILYLQISKKLIKYNDFDKGIKEAIKDWNNEKEENK